MNITAEMINTQYPSDKFDRVLTINQSVVSSGLTDKEVTEVLGSETLWVRFSVINKGVFEKYDLIDEVPVDEFQLDFTIEKGNINIDM